MRKYIIITEEKISQEFRLKNINETRIYFIEKINQNELMNKKQKQICVVLNNSEHLLILFLQLLNMFSFLLLLL